MQELKNRCKPKGQMQQKAEGRCGRAQGKGGREEMGKGEVKKLLDKSKGTRLPGLDSQPHLPVIVGKSRNSLPQSPHL